MGGLIRSICLDTANRHESGVSLLGSSENTPTLPPPGHQGQVTHAGLRAPSPQRPSAAFPGERQKALLLLSALNTRDAYVPS